MSTKPTGRDLVEQLLLKPENWELRLAAATTLADEGRPGEAVALLDAAPTAPGDESDLLQCAELYAKTQPAKAVELLHAWLQEHPEAPVVHLAMADTAMRLGDRAGAVAYYQRAIEIQPEYRDPDLEIRYGLAQPKPTRIIPPKPTLPTAAVPNEAVAASRQGPNRRGAAASPVGAAVTSLTAVGVFLTGWMLVLLVIRSLLAP